jgi:hypothetical protein
MDTDSPAGVMVEDISEVSWEDLIVEMVDPDGISGNFVTTFNCGTSGSGTTYTCLTTNTLTGLSTADG